MNDVISIIVPVYNVSKYIIETMDCVRRQTYADWELLLVEDGSTDGTAEIIQKYMERTQDARIRLPGQPPTTGGGGGRVKEVLGKPWADMWRIWMRMICGRRQSWKRSLRF